MKNKEVKKKKKMQIDNRKRCGRWRDSKGWLLRTMLIVLPVSMTAAVTFGKWLYLLHDTDTSPRGDIISVPQQQHQDPDTHFPIQDAHPYHRLCGDYIHYSAFITGYIHWSLSFPLLDRPWGNVMRCKLLEYEEIVNDPINNTWMEKELGGRDWKTWFNGGHIGA